MKINTVDAPSVTQAAIPQAYQRNRQATPEAFGEGNARLLEQLGHDGFGVAQQINESELKKQYAEGAFKLNSDINDFVQKLRERQGSAAGPQSDGTPGVADSFKAFMDSYTIDPGLPKEVQELLAREKQSRYLAMAPGLAEHQARETDRAAALNADALAAKKIDYAVGVALYPEQYKSALDEVKGAAKLAFSTANRVPVTDPSVEQAARDKTSLAITATVDSLLGGDNPNPQLATDIVQRYSGDDRGYLNATTEKNLRDKIAKVGSYSQGMQEALRIFQNNPRDSIAAQKELARSALPDHVKQVANAQLNGLYSDAERLTNKRNQENLARANIELLNTGKVSPKTMASLDDIGKATVLQAMKGEVKPDLKVFEQLDSLPDSQLADVDISQYEPALGHSLTTELIRKKADVLRKDPTENVQLNTAMAKATATLDMNTPSGKKRAALLKAYTMDQAAQWRANPANKGAPVPYETIVAQGLLRDSASGTRRFEAWGSTVGFNIPLKDSPQGALADGMRAYLREIGLPVSDAQLIRLEDSWRRTLAPALRKAPDQITTEELQSTLNQKLMQHRRLHPK